MRRTIAVLVGLASIAHPRVAAAAEPGAGAVDAVTSSIAVERTMLDEDLQRREATVRRRAEIELRLSQLQGALDAALRQRDQLAAERLDQARAELASVECERVQLVAADGVLLDRVRDRLRRIVLLERELDKLHGRQEQQQAGMLDGSWDLVLMPNEQRGSCLLRQEGTLVTGVYQLEGGFSGSLQGTLVNRKVLLHRIDSRLGKTMELEGYLSADGRTIRGTWLNYELAGRDGSTGQWLAQRKPGRVEPSGER